MFPLPDPSNLFAASQIKFDKLNADLEELTQQMGVAKSHLDEVLISSPQQHIQPFRSRMELSLKQGEELILIEVSGGGGGYLPEFYRKTHMHTHIS